MFPQCRVCAGVFIFCLKRACLKGPLYSAPKHLPANINQKGCNFVVDSHGLGQGQVKKLSYHLGRVRPKPVRCFSCPYLLFTECSYWPFQMNFMENFQGGRVGESKILDAVG